MTKALTNYDKTKISTAHVFLQYDQATMIHKYSLHYNCNGVQREHNKKLNNGLPILHKVPPK